MVKNTRKKSKKNPEKDIRKCENTTNNSTTPGARCETGVVFSVCGITEKDVLPIGLTHKRMYTHKYTQIHMYMYTNTYIYIYINTLAYLLLSNLTNWLYVDGGDKVCVGGEYTSGSRFFLGFFLFFPIIAALSISRT